jgi:energy-coupling factor transporter transmembrane protein EcfT
MFATLMTVPLASAAGVGLGLGVEMAWLAAARLPARVLRAIGVLALFFFGPFVLVLPFLPAPLRGGPVSTSHLWELAARGIAGMLVTAGTMGSLDACDLREALLRLPIPRLVSAILLQIVHQTGTLVQETRRVAAALAVRGATARGRWHIVSALPQVWLPRVLLRAERVAAVMELRGFCDDRPDPFRAVKMGAADMAILLLATLLLALSIALRVVRS